MFLEAEDYLEPECPLKRPSAPEIRSGTAKVSLDKIIAECDRLFNTEDLHAVGVHLRKWLDKAAEIGDTASELTILSELMGHYRMMNDPERGLEAIKRGYPLITKLGIEGTVSAGTILINGATALQAFGFAEESLNSYIEACRCYSENLDPSDNRFAGLYNNMASAYADTGNSSKAEKYYLMALDILKVNHNLMDLAVTYVNLARLYFRNDPHDTIINVCFDCAMDCFNSPDAIRDGYYAHTCRKCASAFTLSGREDDANELNRRADLFYAGNN